MDRDEQPRSVYEQIQETLEQALCWLQRPLAESPDEHDASVGPVLPRHGARALIESHLPVTKRCP